MTTKQDEVTITPGKFSHSCEIRFPTKPSADLRRELVGLGFRWQRESRCWFGARTLATIAADLIKTHTGCAVEVTVDEPRQLGDPGGVDPGELAEDRWAEQQAQMDGQEPIR